MHVLHIDNLELYIGLQAEETKPLIKGTGYTISCAILSDAFALTCGDHFYTQDFTSYNLTAWGFANCQHNPDTYGKDSEDSVYTWFPLIHPDAMEGHLKNLGKVDGYDAARLKPSEPATTVNGYVEVG
ncbi:hypothetical protein BDR04DRAFT_1158618 [Suillus decipiens]|nr:hypothetical protein BDR04DRAFT_1158618 [Suillus decipiens]